MKEMFKRNIYPEKETISELARDWNESIERIETWFRAERKKQSELGKIKYDVKLSIKNKCIIS